MELKKNLIIDSINHDIQVMKASEEYRSKHGLHKKPTVQTQQKAKVILNQLGDEDDDEGNEEEERELFESMQKRNPPRLLKQKGIMNDDPRPSKKLKSTMGGKNQVLDGYFLSQTTNQYTNQQTDQSIIDGMNKVLRVLCIIANGYLYQSFYYCEKAALELQKLDDRQYNSPRVLCILGKAYYDAGDYQSVSHFL